MRKQNNTERITKSTKAWLGKMDKAASWDVGCSPTSDREPQCTGHMQDRYQINRSLDTFIHQTITSIC